MTEFKLIDSSVWVDFLVNGSYKELIEEEDLFFLSSLSLFEIKKKLLKLKYKKEDILKSINFVKQKSNIICPDIEIAEESAEISVEKDMGIVDAIIYITALKNMASVITLDNDFRGLSNTEILDK